MPGLAGLPVLLPAAIKRESMKPLPAQVKKSTTGTSELEKQLEVRAKYESARLQHLKEGEKERKEVLETYIQDFDEETAAALKEKARSYEKAVSEASHRQWRTKHFEALAVLGQGGFGVVHLVRRLDTEWHQGSKDFLMYESNRHSLCQRLGFEEKEPPVYFALKQMRKERYSKKNHRERAFREKEVLEHGGSDYEWSRWIVQLYFTFQDKDFVYMVTEFVQGGDFFKHIEQRGTLNLTEMQFYMAELLVALRCVHGAGFVHRDIKPDNLVLTTQGHLKLLDFGLVKEDDGSIDAPCAEKQVAGCASAGRRRLLSHAGTPQYMAPEAFRGDVSPAVDIWASGVLMFECLYGSIPFFTEAEGASAAAELKEQAEHADEILARKFQKALQRPEQAAVFTKEVRSLIRGMICRDKDKRLTLEQCLSSPFFQGLDVENIHNLRPPIVPAVNGPTDLQHFDNFPRGPALPPCICQDIGFTSSDPRGDWAQFQFDREEKELASMSNFRHWLQAAAAEITGLSVALPADSCGQSKYQKRNSF